MASIHKTKQHGKDVWRCAFYCRMGEKKVRRFIRLGELNRKAAEGIARRVQDLADLTFAGQGPDAELLGWLAKISAELRGKLARAGLIDRQPKAEAKVPTLLGPFLDAYKASRTDVKAGTKTTFGQAQGLLEAHFGRDRDIETITPGDADQFRIWLNGKLGPNTVRRHCGRAKQFFRAAVRRKLLTDNPFADMADTNVKANRQRDYFVTREEAAKVLEACPDHEWQLIFALAQYGGLRTPSELLTLRWGDIDWARSRFTVHSPKTERHEGKATRIVPLFPELRPYLDAVYAAAPSIDEEGGSEFVIVRYRQANANLRTQLERIITRAGLKPWPKLFQNLRASRATELAAVHPSHVAAEWMGHSRTVAAEHYWRVTDADYDRALGGTTGGTDTATQDTTATDKLEPQPTVCQSVSDSDGCGVSVQVTPRGIEPLLPP
jgi:integrase